MNWVTIVWSMCASACLTLAAISCLIWFKNRSTPHLFFATAAAAIGVFPFFEMRIMFAQTPEQLDAALRWGQLPISIAILALIWFVSAYLQAGRPWLWWTILAIRVVFVVPSFVWGGNTSLLEIPRIERIQLFGQAITISQGIPNPWGLLGYLTTFLAIVFVADAGLTAWRRGDRRKALVISGGSVVFLGAGLTISALVAWAGFRLPPAISLYYQAVVAVMAYELSRDVMRAAQLANDLRESEAVLQATHLQIRELAGHLIESQEVERARIARDLHDDLSQQIAGLSIALSGFKRRVAALPGAATLPAEVSAIQQRAVELADNVRNLSHDLHPSVLVHAGLVAALSAHCAQLDRTQSVNVTFSAAGEFHSITTPTALCLYRVAQEALRNVVSHAAASHADVRLVRLDGHAELTIADDGKGFTIAPGRGRGLGLVSINERVRLCGGSVSMVTELNKGTRVRVQVPVGEAALNLDGR